MLWVYDWCSQEVTPLRTWNRKDYQYGVFSATLLDNTNLQSQFIYTRNRNSKSTLISDENFRVASQKRNTSRLLNILNLEVNLLVNSIVKIRHYLSFAVSLINTCKIHWFSRLSFADLPRTTWWKHGTIMCCLSDCVLKIGSFKGIRAIKNKLFSPNQTVRIKI